MAVDSAPTLMEVVTEGLARANKPNLVARAKRAWMREIKNDFAIVAPRSKILMKTEVSITTKGLERYAVPTDYLSDMKMALLSGSEVGVALGGSSSTVTLAADFAGSEADTVGLKVLITGGTGKNSLGQIVALNESTKVATVGISFTNTPAATDTYLIVTREKDLIPQPIWNQGRNSQNITVAEPEIFYPKNNKDSDEFILFPVPDKSTYGLVKTYYADIRRVDLTDSWLEEIFREYLEFFVSGITARATNGQLDWARYLGLKEDIKVGSYGMDLSNVQMAVSDY